MTIWLTGDLHFNKKQFEYLYCNQSSYDLLCLSGDLLDGAVDDYEAQTRWVTDFLRGLSKPLLIASGNHDLDELGECDWLHELQSPNIYVDEQKPVFNGIRFGIVPHIAPEYARFADCDILLTHVPPHNTDTSSQQQGELRQDWGDFELYDLLASSALSPRYVLCGHVENPISPTAQIANTTIINPGTAHNMPKPKIYPLKLL